MADVFISSSRLDEDRVAPIAERLASLGHAVARRDAPAAINGAHAVVVIWSRTARASLRVSAEAAYAAERGVLVQMQIDPVAPPAPFDALPAASFHGENSEWGILEDALAKIANGERQVGAPPRAASLSPIGAPGIVLAALAATLLAQAGALSSAVAGGLALSQLGVVLTGALACAGLCVLVSVWRMLAAVRA
ncbi:MAG: hypothetical protein ABL883_13920 [Terricaulis sp.]